MTITEIVQETRDLCDTDTTDYPDTTLLRRINSALETLVSKIIQVCRNYPYDDENFGNIAEGTIDLQAGVSKYTITDRFLDILEVKVKDVNGNWHSVDPYSLEDAKREGVVLETEEAETGLPLTYRAVGRTLFLAPTPVAASVTLTAGLQFKYTRTSYKITASDLSTGTLIPGLATPWHSIIAKMAALPYCKTNKKDRVPQLQQDILIETNDCVTFYANRQKDRINRITPNVEDCH